MTPATVGQQVVYKKYGKFQIGTLTRIGEKTVGVKSEHGYEDKMVARKDVRVYSEDNVHSLFEIDEARQEIEKVTEPLYAKIRAVNKRIEESTSLFPLGERD